MNRRPASRAVALVGFLAMALVPGASAQAPSFAPQPVGERIAWPSGFPAPQFRRVVGGELTGDGLRDAVTLSGDVPVLLWNPVYCDAQLALPGAARDIDVAIGLGGDGRDALAVVDDEGLSLVLASSLAPLEFEREPVATGAWTEAVLVRCADVDGAGGVDFLGAAGSEVLLLFGAGSTVKFLAGSTVVDLAPLHWDVDPHLEIAVLTTTGVRVFDLVGPGTGTLLDSYAPTSDPDGAIVAVRGTSRHRLAYLYRSAGHPLVTVLAPGSPPAAPIALPDGFDAFALGTADLDGDGKRDLLISQRDRHQPLFLKNQLPAATWFVTPADWGAQVVDDDPELAEATANDIAAAPLIEDLDANGRADLLFAIDGLDVAAHRLPGHVAYLGGPDPELTASTFLESGFLAAPPNASYVAHLRIDQAEHPFPAGATHYEVFVWRQPAGSALLDAVMSRTVHPGAATAAEDYVALQIGIDADDCEGFDEMFWFDVRPVMFQSGSVSYSTWPKRFGAFAAEADSLIGMVQGGDTPFSFVHETTPRPSGVTDDLARECEILTPSDGTTPTPALVNRGKLPRLPPLPPPAPAQPTEGTTRTYD